MGNNLFIIMALWKRFPDSTDWTVPAKHAVSARPNARFAPNLQMKIAAAAFAV